MKIKTPTEPNTCEDILQCLYNLNELDLTVYQSLKKTGPIRADKLAQKLKKERSTIYRSLQKLNHCGICIKKTNTIEQGGYYHTYICNDLNDIKQSLDHCIDDWYHTLKKTIKNL